MHLSFNPQSLPTNFKNCANIICTPLSDINEDSGLMNDVRHNF